MPPFYEKQVVVFMWEPAWGGQQAQHLPPLSIFGKTIMMVTRIKIQLAYKQ
jgi:hypothetical protein